MDMYSSNYIYVHNYLEAGGSLRAPIFYDSNNTGFYGDFASTSNFNALRTFSYQGNGNVGGTGNASWHPSGIYSAGYNWLYGGINMNGGNLDGAGAIFATIYYDRNDTGYYLDPNSTSNEALRVRGGVLFGPNPTWGQYLAVGTNGHWSSSFASVAVTDGNLHLDSRGGNGLYLQWYVGGPVFVNDDIRAQIFYDRNDTGYYADPNGTSNFARFTNRTHAAMNRGHHWITPRFDYTGDTNYWTGTFGWGTSAGNWDNAWRAGFAGWDIWGTGTGHPQGGGYIHAQGIVSGLHYATSDGGSAYGWMMVGAADATANRYWARGKWGGSTSGWREFVMNDSNQSYVLYAQIMYDSNNTGFFVDPNGRSRLSSIDYGDGSYYFRGGSWGWRHQTPSGYIEFGPANSGHAHIYTDRSNFYYNVDDSYLNGRRIIMENRWLSNTYYGTGGDMYATIWYDTNDTGYRLDPNGSSRLNFVHTNNLYIQPGHMLYSDPGGWTGEHNKLQWHSSHLYAQMIQNGYFIMRYGSDGLESHQFARDGNHWTRYLGWLSNWANQNVRTDAGPTFQEVYTNGWFRNNNNNQGLYNQNNGNHWYSDATYWKIGNNNSGAGGILMRHAYEGALKGYLGYWDGGGFGMLNSSGNWQIRIEYGNAHMELYRITYMDDARAYIFYDRNNTAYYCDPTGYSQLSSGEANNYWRAARYDMIGVGGNSGQGAHAYSIFQEGGGWGFPFPDLRIAYHTGIKFGANPSYEGMRFYNDYPMGSLIMQINGGSEYIYKYRWMYTTSSGFYSDTNGAHWYPNPGNSSYGAWRTDGNRNGWYGINIGTGNNPHVMFDGSGNGGFYNEGGGRWILYYSHGNNCSGFGTSSTSSAYRIYVGGAIFAEGNIVAFSDRRKKENIETVENALETLKKLRGVYYTATNDVDQKRQVGVIAQEVEEVLPEVVTYASDVDEYGVDYGKFAGLFIESIKEQQKIIEKQQSQIDELTRLVKTLINSN
jgi:hypothetical protein